MKIPCELIVWYVLPSIRRELARELVEKHHLSQAEVARRFGATSLVGICLTRAMGKSGLKPQNWADIAGLTRSSQSVSR